MKTVKLLAFLSLVWMLAACGSVENAPLETLAPPPCSPFSPPNESCPWGTKFMSMLAFQVAVGPDGNVYVAARHSDTNWILHKYSKYGSLTWTTTPIGIQDHSIWVKELRVDSQGNTYVLTVHEDIAVINKKIQITRLSKISPSGSHLWTKQVNRDSRNYPSSGPRYMAASGLALDPQGRAVVMISKWDEYDIYTYDASGTLIGYYGTYHTSGIVRDFAIDNNGSMYLVGDDEYGPDDYAQTAFLFVLNASFTQVGTLFWAGGVEVYSDSVTLDSQYNIFVTGDADPSSERARSLWKFTPALQIAWQVNRLFYDLAIDSSNNVYGVGVNNKDAFIQKISGATGTVLWSTTWHKNLSEYNSGNGVATGSGYVYMVGGSWMNNISTGYINRYATSSGTQK